MRYFLSYPPLESVTVETSPMACALGIGFPHPAGEVDGRLFNNKEALAIAKKYTATYSNMIRVPSSFARREERENSLLFTSTVHEAEFPVNTSKPHRRERMTQALLRHPKLEIVESTEHKLCRLPTQLQANHKACLSRPR
jgi:hypothetical protein